MALTRKMLKAMGIDEEKIEQIIEAHSEAVDGLKADLSKYKDDAEKLASVQKELAALKEKGDEGWKEKHDKVKKEFDDFKAEQTNKETHRAKETAYRDLLKAAGISEKRIDAVIRVSDLDKVELEDGKIKDADKLTATVKTEWADFIETQRQTGIGVSTPPANNGSGTGKTKAEILAIKDTAARQKAIAENPALFGI